MKGVIFNLLQEVVVAAHGERAWDDLLDWAGLDGVYTSLGSYDDAELMRLVAAAAALLSITGWRARMLERLATPVTPGPPPLAEKPLRRRTDRDGSVPFGPARHRATR